MRIVPLFLGVCVLLVVGGTPAAARDYREGYTEFLALRPTADGALPVGTITKNTLRFLMTPGSYDILNYEEGEESYCRRYVMESVALAQSRKMRKGLPVSFSITVRGSGADYCEVVDPDVDYDEASCAQPQQGIGCQCSTDSDGVQRCQTMRLPRFSLTLTKQDDRLVVEGLSGPIRIARRPQQRLPYEWGGSEFYDYARVVTRGELRMVPLPTGASAHVYTTPWKPVFSDLRGIGYLRTETRQGPWVFGTLYDGPPHNRSSYLWSSLFMSYDECLAGGQTPFCLKREGNKLVIASRSEALGTTLTLWMDEHFKR